MNHETLPAQGPVDVNVRGWIAPDIQMPDDDQEVLVAVQWGNDDPVVCAGQWYEGVWYGSWFDDNDPIQEIFGVVLAWMPYPTYTPNEPK